MDGKFWGIEIMKKKIMSVLLAFALVVPVFAGATTEKVEAANVKSTYEKFIKNQMQKGNIEGDEVSYYLYDFNKDGVKELIVSEPGGARGIESVYTIVKGKVKYLVSDNSIGYIKGKKYIVCYGSGGAMDWGYDLYTISGGKAKKATSYKCDMGVYKKGNKKIDAKAFNKFEKTVKLDLGNSTKVSKYTYTSAKKIGFSFDAWMKPEDLVIKKVSNSSISYYTLKWDPETGNTISKGKVKSAKITSSTKFYYGDSSRLYSSQVKGSTMNDKEWLKKLSKSEFMKIMKTYKDAPNIIKVKNGKAQYIVINIHIAD